MTTPCIHGLVMARDEWPLLALSIEHALRYHVDRVWVLDHASTDGTCSGLDRLRRAWGVRLMVVHLGETPYFQEAATCLALHVVAPQPHDWVYVFDADEFGITGPGQTLRDILSAVPAAADVLRYDIHNWVSTRDFDAGNLDDYLTLRHRAVVNDSLNLPLRLVTDEIVHGSVNYFDLPFHPKVIVRGKAAVWLAAGAHAPKPRAPLHWHTICAERFRVAHFPFLSRARLQTRARQGVSYRENEFPSWHGWQSQMIAHLDEAGRLDDFWARHSVGPGATDVMATSPHVIADDRFAEAIHPTIEHLRNTDPSLFREAEQIQGAPAVADASLLVPAALHAIRGLQELASSLVEDVEAAIAARNAAHAALRRAEDELAAALAGRDAGLDRLATAVAERKDAETALHKALAARKRGLVGRLRRMLTRLEPRPPTS